MFAFPIKPMLLQSIEKPFNSKDFIYEWKVDGVRCLMFFKDKKVQLQSRNGKECTVNFPELMNPFINENVIIDGELTILTNGKPDFEGVMERFLAPPKEVARKAVVKPVRYIVWDILWYKDKSTIDLSLLNRKEILDTAVNNNDYIIKIDWVDSEGTALWKAIKEHGLEGIIAKRKDSKYILGQRTKKWLKTKNFQHIVVDVLGYKPKDGIVLVSNIKDKIQGHAFGINAKDREALWELLNSYGKEDRDTIWLPEGIQGEVKFTSWTPKGYMRDCGWVRFII